MEQTGFTPGLFQEEVTIQVLLEALGQAVVMIDHFRNILLVNKRAEEMFGYQAAELVRKPHNILIPKRFLEIHMDHMDSYFKEPRIRPMGIGLDLFGMRKDGTEFPVEISLSYVTTRNGILIFSLITDISVRKNAEAQIHQKAELLANANRELERFNRIAVGRELRMIEMKKEINALCERLGEPPRYSLGFTDEESK
jgi:protein-histidine pros-kinase